MTATRPRIGFVGAGNMSTALIRGLLRNGWPPACMQAGDPDPERRRTLATDGIGLHADNAAIAAGADILVLAVKPDRMAAALASIQSACKAQPPLTISVAAGVHVATIAEGLGQASRIVRAMPNMPALAGVGATGLFGWRLHATDRRLVEDIFGTVGICEWLQEEQLIDAVTAVSGSGPAYFFLFMEAMIAAGERLGLSNQQARSLTLHAALGAATLGLDADLHSLRAKVTSPGGTTETALAAFADANLAGIVDTAMRAAWTRSRALGAAPGPAAADPSPPPGNC